MDRGRPLSPSGRWGCQLKGSLLSAVTATVMLSACQAPQSRPTVPLNVPLATYSGGDGTTAQEAVVINANTDLAATRAEYAWLREHVPGSTLSHQSLIREQNRVYDLMEVNLPDGTKRSYFFDITETFGKL